MKKLISCIVSVFLIASFGTVFSSAAYERENIVEMLGGYEFVRDGDTAYYPYEINLGDTYGNICKRLSGFDDGSTKIGFKLIYQTDTLNFVGAYPSYELKALNGTVTVKSVGTFDETMNYADIEINVDGFTSITNNMVLFNVKYNILKENFVSEQGIVNPLSMICEATWSVSSADNSYNFGNYANFDTMFITDGITYETLTRRFKDYKIYDPANSVDAESITLSTNKIKIKINESYQLTAIVAPNECTGYNINWTSSDPSVAVVDANGNVTAVGRGTAIITATVDGTNIVSTSKVIIPYTPIQLFKVILSFLFGWLFK